jgi:hypothetical protein
VHVAPTCSDYREMSDYYLIYIVFSCISVESLFFGLELQYASVLTVRNPL